MLDWPMTVAYRSHPTSSRTNPEEHVPPSLGGVARSCARIWQATQIPSERTWSLLGTIAPSRSTPASDRISQKDSLYMKPHHHLPSLIASLLSAAILAACGGGGDSSSSSASGSTLDAQANKVATSTTPVSATVTPASSVVLGEGWVSASPGVIRERNTTPTSATVAGDSYYVDAAAGNDSNAGTLEAPWKTRPRHPARCSSRVTPCCSSAAASGATL